MNPFSKESLEKTRPRITQIESKMIRVSNGFAVAWVILIILLTFEYTLTENQNIFYLVIMLFFLGIPFSLKKLIPGPYGMTYVPLTLAHLVLFTFIPFGLLLQLLKSLI